MAEHETEPAAKRRCLPQPIPKHTIFLSHSGNEKPFTEQLCEDLKRVNHDPFFDQDSYSLPKGVEFPPLIFSAANQCSLGVVVLSEGYLSSKWPMLELSTFVKSMKGENPSLKLFPVFYKLSPSDLSDEKVETQWRESWEKLVQEGKVSAEEIASWSDAVRKLRAFNGMEFSKYGTSKVRYRAAVVEEICKNVRPMMKYKTDHIRGYDRLCEITSGMFVEGTSGEIICREGCYYLGLYGLGGVGKSTLCEAMCSYFQKDYGSRVCYLELPSDSEEQSAKKGRISRLKSVIQRLTGFDTSIVDSIDSESQGLGCLQSRLRDRPPVFLAVDNVGDPECSREEALGLVKTVFPSGSKVMVTSRSRAILRTIFGEEKYCKGWKGMKRESCFFQWLFQRKCPLQPFEDEIVEACLGEYQFAEDGFATRQYHPLVLRALGSYFQDVDQENILNWKKHIVGENKLQGCRDTEKVKKILGLNYSSLSDKEKLVFLDVALLFNSSFTIWEKFVDIVGSNLEVKDCEWQVSFIAILHGIDLIDAENQVKKLQRMSLIYEGSRTLGLHDLYLEFAQSLVMKDGSQERKWWVYSKNSADGKNFGLMKRICLDGGKAKIFHNPHQLQQCEKLECLMIIGCEAPKNYSLDLGCLRRLRVLILENVGRMVEIVCSSNGDGDEGCLPELQIVRMRGCDLERIPFVTECDNLRSLSIDLFEAELVKFIHSVESKISEKLKALEVLHLSYFIQARDMPCEGIFNYTSGLQSLRFLEVDLEHVCFEDSLVTSMSIDVSPLGGLPKLSALYLSLCKELEVQGLEQLSGLSTLKLWCGVSKLEGVDQLSQLTTLDLGGCDNLRLLPDLGKLPNL